MQCCFEYSYLSGSGDSRSHSLPHSSQMERKHKGNIQDQIKKWQNYCFASVVPKHKEAEKWHVQHPATGAQFFVELKSPQVTVSKFAQMRLSVPPQLFLLIYQTLQIKQKLANALSQFCFG